MFATVILNTHQHRHGPAFALRSGYLTDFYNKEGWISELYEDMRRYETMKFENDTQINLAEAQLSTGRKENLQLMENIHLKLFKDNLIGYLAKGNKVTK